MSNEKLCVDRVIPAELDDEAMKVAVEENPENATDALKKLGLVSKKMWRNGKTLRVKFLDGSPKLRERVKHYANMWTKHANLHFEFGNSSKAEIRVSFEADPGRSWSAVGTDSLVTSYFPRHQPTMNFGWFDDTTDDKELSRVIVHEFGHAIGCIHEHQNPAGGIEWDEAAVIATFSGRPNYWDEATIRHNILNKYAENTLTNTDFDEKSIMLYSFPGRLMKNRPQGTQENDELSPTDIAFIAKTYPKKK